MNPSEADRRHGVPRPLWTGALVRNVLLAGFFLLSGGYARAQVLPDRGYLPGSPPPFHVSEPKDTTVAIAVVLLAPGVYAAKVDYVWTGWVVLPDGILLVDTSIDGRTAAALADTIQARSGKKPVRWVVNTHSHDDHVGGDAYFASRGASLYAQTSQAAKVDSIVALQLQDSIYADTRSRVKPATRVDHMTRLGTSMEPVQVIWLGHPAHTSGDLIVYLPKQRIAFAGDLVSNHAVPWLMDPDMSVAGWNASLDSLVTKRYPIDKLVPGHGEYAEPFRSLGYTRNYLKDANEKATRVASWGTTVAQVRDWGYLGPYEDSEFYAIIHFMNMRRLYNEAKGIKTPGRARAGAIEH
jgi:cyclase